MKIRTTVGALRGAVRRALTENLPPLRGPQTVRWNDTGETDTQFYDDEEEWEETEIPGTDLVGAAVGRIVDYMEDKVGMAALMQMSSDRRYEIALRGAAWAGVEEDAVEEVAEAAVEAITNRHQFSQYR